MFRNRDILPLLHSGFRTGRSISNNLKGVASLNNTNIAINGFGRIGRNAFKIAFDRPDLDIVAINDLTDTKTLAYLLKHDSNYGLYEKDVKFDEKNLIVAGQSIQVLAEKDPAKLPWKELNIDIAIEATGLFTKHEQLQMHLNAGAKRVILSAP